MHHVFQTYEKRSPELYGFVAMWNIECLVWASNEQLTFNPQRDFSPSEGQYLKAVVYLVPKKSRDGGLPL